MQVIANVANSNGAAGIVVGAVHNAVISANTLDANGDTGLFMFDLLRSTVSGNASSGNPVGLVLAAGQHGSTANRIKYNTSSHNSSTGIVIDHAANNTIVANTANANLGKPGTGGGIIVVGATGNTVLRNVADHNHDVGVGIFDDAPGDSAGNTLTGNTANFNGAHGIDVVPGTVDGGGNQAHHNRPSPNCQGVVCS